MKKKILAGLLCAVILSLTGCGSGVTGSSVSMTESAADTAYYSANGASKEAKAVTLQEGVETNTANMESNRKLIKTVNMNVETEVYDNLLSTVQDKVEVLGGYIENFTTSGTNNRYADITARIPKDRMEEFCDTVENSSNVTYRQESVEDVTLNYVDLESHKKMLLKEQERLLELLDKAETLEDIITLESRLTEVQYQIESMESQLRTYDNQIDYSTIYLSINEVERYTPQEQKGTWEQIKTGFTENLYSVGQGIRNLFISFVIHIPNLFVFLIVIGILALIVKGMLHIEKKSAKKREAERTKQTQQMPYAQNVMQQQGTVNNTAANHNVQNTAQNHNTPQK